MRVDREKLIQALEYVRPGLAKREVVEQSSCFVFQDNNVMTFNDEVACIYKSPIDVIGAVQADPLLAILHKLQEDDVDVRTKPGELIVAGKSRKVGLTLEKEITLPYGDVETPGDWTPLPDEFDEAVTMASECASKDQSQYAYTCVHITPKYIEACDNFQALRYNTKIGLKEEFLIRHESIKQVVSLGMSKINQTKNWVHFQNEVGLIISCRYDLQEYDELKKIFSQSNGTAATLPKGLAEAADRANVFSSEADDNVISVELKPGGLKIKGQSAAGWYTEKKKIRYDGDPMSFKISPKLLAQLSKNHNECSISPKSVKVEGDKFTYVACLEKGE